MEALNVIEPDDLKMIKRQIYVMCILTQEFMLFFVLAALGLYCHKQGLLYCDPVISIAHGKWDSPFPNQGIKPESPVLESRFLTAGGEWLKSQVLETSLVAAQEEGADRKKVGRAADHFHLSERTQAGSRFYSKPSRTVP